MRKEEPGQRDTADARDARPEIGCRIHIKDEATYQQAKLSFERHRLDALVVIGGEGSQRIGYELFLMGVPVIGVPKAIDNDLCGTDLTL